MDNITYTKKQIEELLNIINTFNFVGFDSANKIVKIYQILNNAVKVDEK